jgi:hypothetical protein
MASQLDIDPQIANQLLALAKARGVTVEALLRGFVEQEKQAALPEPSAAQPTSEEFESDMQALTEGTEGLGSRYAGSYSREDIYFDHD